MTDSNHCQRLLFLPVMAWIGFLLGVASAIASYVTTGPSLGLFFGGIIFAALLVPPLGLSETRSVDRLLIAGAVNDGIGVVWLVAVFASQITLVQWLLCYVILVAWCFALIGVAIFLARVLPRCDHRGLNGGTIVASAITVLLAFGWISSPVWPARLMPEHSAIVDYLVPAHPLLATNGVLRNLGAWSERPIAYRSLLTLGQDVPYALPRSIAPVALVHLLLGAGALMGAASGRK